MKSSDLMSLRFIIGLGAVLLTPGAATVAAPVTDGPRPVIAVPETSKDGGVVEEGTVIPFQFTVTNRGQADLELTRVETSCGCTLAQWDRVIKPGAQGTIRAQMHTDYFRGSVTKYLTVFSNDPARPQVELTVSAHLLPLVKISPGLGALLVVGDKPASREFTLERSGGRPMKIVQVIPNAQFVNAATTPLPGVGRYKLTVTALPDAPLGRSPVPVEVWTDVRPDAMLTFVVMVERGIVTDPPMVFFGIVPHGMKTQRQAAVTIMRNLTRFHIKSVTVNDPHLALKLETVRDSIEYRVTVTYAGGWDIGRRQQMLTVTTDDPKQPVIEIPVQAYVKAEIANAPPMP